MGRGWTNGGVFGSGMRDRFTERFLRKYVGHASGVFKKFGIGGFFSDVSIQCRTHRKHQSTIYLG